MKKSVNDNLKGKVFVFGKKTWLFIAFFIPLVLSLIIMYLIFGNLFVAFQKMLQLKGNPTRTADAVVSLAYIGTILIASYGLITTALFSYLVWRVSIESFRVSKELKNLEENRDKETIREQALIVYYDLQRGFSYIRNLHISTLIKNKQPNPKLLFFSEDWIKNVATLRNELSNEELNKIYEIYNDFFTLQSLLKDYSENHADKNNEVSQAVEVISKKIFAEFIPLQILTEFEDSTTEDLLEINLYIILQKIFLVTFSDSQIKKKKGDSSSDVLVNESLFYTNRNGEIWNGEGTLFTAGGYEKANGFFINGLFMTGTVYGYAKSKWYSIEYRDIGQERKIINGEIIDLKEINDEHFYYKGEFQDGKLFNGITTLFNRDGSIAYRGHLVNGVKEGRAISYNSEGEIYFKGTYEQGLRIKGVLFNKGKEVFKGDFQNGRPWNGQVIKFHFNNEKIKNFTGEMIDGKPYNGTGTRFKRNQDGEELEFLLHQESWEPEDGYEKLLEESYHANQNEYTRKEYSRWEDYIVADWINGKPVERDDTENNLTVYF